MLASPLIVGVLAGGPRWVHLPLAAFWFTGYFAFFAASIWLKAGRRERDRPPVLCYTTGAAALGIATAAADPPLLRWVPVFVVPLAVGLWAAANRRERALLSGLTTVLGSSAMTLVSYAAGPGDDWRRATALAAVQALYFSGTVFYVKSLIRQRGNERFRAVSVGVHATATVALAVGALLGRAAVTGPPLDSWPGAGIWWLVAVFAVLTLRAAVVPRFRISPARIGMGEIGATLLVDTVSLLTV